MPNGLRVAADFLRVYAHLRRRPSAQATILASVGKRSGQKGTFLGGSSGYSLGR
jgi:hypothetical protein